MYSTLCSAALDQILFVIFVFWEADYCQRIQLISQGHENKQKGCRRQWNPQNFRSWIEMDCFCFHFWEIVDGCNNNVLISRAWNPRCYMVFSCCIIIEVNFVCWSCFECWCLVIFTLWLFLSLWCHFAAISVQKDYYLLFFQALTFLAQFSLFLAFFFLI